MTEFYLCKMKNVSKADADNINYRYIEILGRLCFWLLY